MNAATPIETVYSKNNANENLKQLKTEQDLVSYSVYVTRLRQVDV